MSATPVTVIDPRTHVRMRADMKKAAEFIAKRYGVAVEVENDRESDSYRASFAVRLTVCQDAEGNEFDPAAEEFRRLATMVGADPDWYGRTFRHKRSIFRVTGISPGRPKNPMSFDNVRTGKAYKGSVEFVRACMR